MNESDIFEVYEEDNDLFTKNLTPGISFFDEDIVNREEKEYRRWNPYRSKLAAAIKKGCPNIFFRKGSSVLYLGCGHGYTVSYCSDIVGNKGFIFGVDISSDVMRDFIPVCRKRSNIAPILADVNNPSEYSDKISSVDIVYQDVSQSNQVDIFLKNIDDYLKDDGYGLFMVKSRSIDVSSSAEEVYDDVRERLNEELNIIDFRELDPYQEGHCLFICKK